MRITKEQVKDWSSTSTGAFLFGFLAMADVDKQALMNVFDSVSAVIDSFNWSNITIGGALSFFFYQFKRGAK